MSTATQFRAAQAAIVADLERSFAGVWSATGGEFRLLVKVLPDLVRQSGAMASTVAADWYELRRDVERIPGGFRVTIPAPGDPRTGSLVRWAAKHAASPDSLVPLITGGLVRRVLNEGRDTIAAATVEDPEAQGWQRQARADGCGFCAMLASRGPVYTKKSVRFASHDNCKCIAVPAFRGRPLPVQPYTPSKRQRSEGERKAVREWIAKNI